MTLDAAAKPYRPPDKTVTIYQVHGKMLTKPQVLTLAYALHNRGDHAGSLRVLTEAGLWPHDLIEQPPT